MDTLFWGVKGISDHIVHIYCPILGDIRYKRSAQARSYLNYARK